MKNRDNKFKGFTLIELMIVVAIIGIVAGTSAPRFAHIIRMNRIERAKAHLKSYEQALRNYYSDVHRLPAAADPTIGGGIDTLAKWENYMREGLSMHDEDPDGEDSTNNNPITNWHGPYMGQLLLDPWDNPYVFQDNRKNNNLATAIISGGPQGTINIDFDKTSGPLAGELPNERGFSVVEIDSNDYMIVLWLE